jgi:hypothetical protein
VTHTIALILLGVTALLGMTLAGGVLREIRNPAMLRRFHMIAGASSLVALLREVSSAASATPPLPGSTGRLPAGFVACALLLGLSLWLVRRNAPQSLTIVRALHICIGFCGLVLAAAWLLRPGG